MLGDKAIDDGVRIRHGIQREAPRSALFGKVYKNEFSLALRSLPRHRDVLLPSND